MQLKLAAERIRRASKVVIIAGAGISVACGIPDFRTPGSGLYNNLAKYGLPEPTCMFHLDYFIGRPRPCSELQGKLFPDVAFRPSYTHCFFRLLQNKGKLHYMITQNIDDIEKTAGISKLFQAHGTFSNPMKCVSCGFEMPSSLCQAVSRDTAVAHCEKCGRMMKAGVVFFGENLPPFVSNVPKIVQDSDALIVAGTSLVVSPVCNWAVLAQQLRKPRILLNNEVRGTFVLSDTDAKDELDALNAEPNVEDSDDNPMKKDACLIGDCDSMSKALAAELGWAAELEEIHASFAALGGQKFVVEDNAGAKLTTVVLQSGLMVPTAKTFVLNGETAMFANVNDEQLALLTQRAKSSTPTSEKWQHQHNVEKMVFTVKSDYYRPFGGHYAFYLTEFEETLIAGMDDVWDQMTTCPQADQDSNFGELTGTIRGKWLETITGEKEVTHSLKRVRPLSLGGQQPKTFSVKFAIKSDADSAALANELATREGKLGDNVIAVIKVRPVVKLEGKVLVLEFSRDVGDCFVQLKQVVKAAFGKLDVEVEAVK